MQQPQYGQPQYNQAQYSQAQYGQPYYAQQQQQPYPGAYQQQPGFYIQQPVMQPAYGQQQVLGETVLIVQEIPQGYPTQQPMMGMDVGAQQDRYLPNNANGSEYPVRIKCPACQKNCTTIVEAKSGGAVYGWVALTCFCCFPFCCVPCFIDSCKDKIHKCPFCQAEVGINQKSMC